MSLRVAVADDAAALSVLHNASFREGWTRDDFTTWLARSEAICLVAEQAGEVVAFGLALASGSDAELLTIASVPALRGQGFGRRIMQGLQEEAASRGLDRWILEVARTNLPALGLYKSEGFVEIGVRKDYYPGEAGRVDALVMARSVAPAGGQGRA